MPRVLVVVPEVRGRADAVTFFGGDAAGAGVRASRVDERVLLADLGPREIAAAEAAGARVFPDVRFEHFRIDNPFEWRPPRARYWRWGRLPDPDGPSLKVGLPEVLHHVRAPEAWEVSRGANVTLGVLDTGVDGSMVEFEEARRSPIDLRSPFHGGHWTDAQGHGSMCACIAVASLEDGGRFSGVAPDATLLSARTSFWASDLYEIYDELIDLRRQGELAGPLVLLNAYGAHAGAEPEELDRDHPFCEIVREAVAAGIVVVFAAGNNHVSVAGFPPGSTGPGTIWGVNSDDAAITVGTVGPTNSNVDAATSHQDSSRGPGQWATETKPNVVAPTYGEVLWGGEHRVMDWWGTSGAAALVAGLAALLLARDPTLTPADVKTLLERTARQPEGIYQAFPNPCVGHGVIDCKAAIDAI